MLEIPESKVISLQIEEVLAGKRIVKVKNATSPHKFAWYEGDSAERFIFVRFVRDFNSFFSNEL